MSWKSVGSLAIGLGFALAAQVASVQLVRVPNSGMEPTISKGESLVVEVVGEEAAGAIERGRIVAFRAPGASGDLLIKRIVGVPGDRLEMRNKMLVRNGVTLDEPYAEHRDERLYGTQPDDAPDYVRRDQLPETVVPAEHFFVLGDNRDFSYDSRSFGAIPWSSVVGVVRR